MATDTKSISKSAEKDLRQTILDSIESKYGLMSADVMEKAFKEQDKQLKDAMGPEGGMTAHDIAKTRGIDLSQFASQDSTHDPNSPNSSVSSVGTTQIPQIDMNQLTQMIAQQLSGLSQAAPPTSQELLQKGQTQVPIGGMKGFSALSDLVQGKGFNPMAQWTAPIGFTGASKMAEYDMARQKAMLDNPKTIIDILSSLQSYAHNSNMNPVQERTAGIQEKQAQQNLEQGTTQAKLAYDKEQQNIKDTAGNITNSGNAAATAQSLFDIRNSIKMKGHLGGNILGATVDFLSGGTEKRSDYNSTVNQFVFDIGTLLGQKGRAFSEKEQDLVRKQILNAGLSKSDDAFKGSMKAVFRRINTVAGEDIISFDKKTGKVVMKQPNQSTDKSSLQVGATGKAKDGTPVTWDGKNWVG